MIFKAGTNYNNCQIVSVIRRLSGFIKNTSFIFFLEKFMSFRIDRMILTLCMQLYRRITVGLCLLSATFSKLMFALLLSVNVSADDFNITLRAETWDMPRHGEALLKVPELSSVIQKWMLDPQQKIELRYPGGEEGELWVEELKDWFVSLGVPSNAIQLSPGSNAEDIINIVLINTVKK